ncbi:MAG: P-loop NTPase [Helicobacteraceae bacterium]|nr:P-loop NTPase [Helicobacteraceae bacterium]
MRDKLLLEVNSLTFPNLTKTIGELKLIDTLNIKDQTLDIILSTTSDDTYLTLKDLLEERYKSLYSTISITKKAQKKDMNYGNSTTPNNRAPYAKNVIAVTSGKGGVGKSTVCVNTAIALAQKGYSVGLLDADVYGPNVARLTKTENEKLKWDNQDKMIPAENFGIKIMSVAHTTPKMDTPLVWRSSVAVSALMQFLEDVAWGELDFLVIDMPPGTGDVQLTMAQELPISAAILVTTPQLISTDDVSRAIMMFKDIKVPMAGIVENMSYFIAPDTQKRYNIFGSGGGEEIAKKYNLNLLAQIPLNMQIREGSDLGLPPIALGSEELKKYYQEVVENMLKNIEFNID